MANGNQSKQGKEEKPYPIFLTRRVGGLTVVTGISHWSNEDPPPDSPLYKRQEQADPKGEEGEVEP